MKYKDTEFTEIIKPIVTNKKFQELKGRAHHGTTRYSHSLRVAYYSYKTSKALHLNYQEITTAALMHDFFTDEVQDENGFDRLIDHPSYALANAKKYYDLSYMQEDIIKNHMYPITLEHPHTKEAMLVDTVDNIVSIKERLTSPIRHKNKVLKK
jgi:uncharacterized protein